MITQNLRHVTYCQFYSLMLKFIADSTYTDSTTTTNFKYTYNDQSRQKTGESLRIYYNTKGSWHCYNIGIYTVDSENEAATDSVFTPDGTEIDMTKSIRLDGDALNYGDERYTRQ